MTLRDDLGRAVTIPRPARRVVSLTPATTENLFAIGAGPVVVGVTNMDNFPDAVKSLPRVADLGYPSYERLLALKPDLIVLDSATIVKAEVDKLAAKIRCPVFVQRSQKMADVPRHLEELGRLTGREREARTEAGKFRRAVEIVRKRVAGKPRPTVFVEVSDTPLYAAGASSFVGDVALQAGGVNVVTEGGPFPVVSKELLLTKNPAHYVIAVGKLGGPKHTFSPPLDRLAAARTGQVHEILADTLFRPTPRLLGGLTALAAALHP